MPGDDRLFTVDAIVTIFEFLGKEQGEGQPPPEMNVKLG
jgi:hypothetical protein